MKREEIYTTNKLQNNTMTTQKLVSSLSHCSMELGQNKSGSASSEQPGSGCMMSNEARMMQTTMGPEMVLVYQGHRLSTL